MLRDLLRSATRHHHERIERSLAITESIKSKRQYMNLIERFYGFYVAIELKQSRFMSELLARRLELNHRLKTRTLMKDLVALGYNAGSIANLPVCTRLPLISDLSHVFGSLYVIEGSTLGGQFISAHFQESLEISPENGGAFFFGYGADTGKMWRQFIEHLNSYGDFNPDHIETIRTACETFECLEAWLLSPQPL